MNSPALLTTLTIHAGAWGVLTLMPSKTARPLKATVPVSILYRKPAAVAAPPPMIIPAPAPRLQKPRRHRAARPKPAVIVAPPALLTEPASVPTASSVQMPVAPAPPAAEPSLPQISEAALPEGYVQEEGFTFAPLYRVTQPPRLLKPLQLKYPDRAREFQKEGVVIIEADIDAKGHVISARIIEEPGWGFGEAALKAVLGTEFSPAQIGPTAVPVRYRIPIRFKMDFS